MKTQTWNGSNGSFETASAWSLDSVPVFGDVAIINSGTVVETGSLDGVVVQLGGTTSADLTLRGAILSNATSIVLSGYPDTVVVQGIVTNQGTIAFAGPVVQAPSLVIENDGVVAGVLKNQGMISITSSPDISGGVLENDGQIVISNPPASGLQMPIISVPVTGTGTTTLTDSARVAFLASVGSGQTITFAPGAADAILEFDAPSSSTVTIQGFVQSDLIALINLPQTILAYAATSATSGTLTLSNGGVTLVSENLRGVYTAADFTKTYTTFGGSGSNTNITTTATTPSVSYTDVATNTSGHTLESLYDGPVSYLQWQYIWPSADAVAIAAAAPNAFIKGGPGGDAIQVTSGNNVIDGGAGSNFLIGGTGTDGGTDTFFVDGRGGDVTWSTIKNFHQGDQATIFGFLQGVSTLPVTASDGAAGYTGVTIHSELAGAGTGVDASLTFTGLTQDTFDNHFTLTTGTLSPDTSTATPYLLIQYNR